MAESRCGQEQSMRDVRDSGGGRRHSRGPNASAERNKPDQPSSSQGALSSIRAAIMRTSRSTAQEQHRERRRPQITILSAEPMAPSWFPAAPPPSAVQLPPPSYEQVLREKSREQQQQQHLVSPAPPPVPPAPVPPPAPATAPPPTASVSQPPAPSHSTIATQTDAPPTLPPLPLPPPAPTTTPQTTADKPATRAPLRRPPRPPRPPCPPRPDTDTLPPPSNHPPEEGEAVRPRPRPRSRAGLRPISQEVFPGSQPISSVGIPKSRSLSSEIVVAQPIGGERTACRSVDSEHHVASPSGDQSEGGCVPSDGGVCLGAEGVCVGSQYLQDLLDVFGPDSAHRHAQHHGNIDECHREEDEEREEEEVEAVAVMVAVTEVEREVERDVEVEERGVIGGGTSPRPLPKPRRRTETGMHTSPPASISGSPSPPQPRPRRRSLSTSTSTPQSSLQVLDGPIAPRPGLPPRLLPLRPPPIKPAKPPHLIGPCSTTANQQQGQRLPKRGPPLPPRPKPGHALYRSSQNEDVDLMDLTDTLADLNTHTDVQTCANVHADSPVHVDAITDTTTVPMNMPVNPSTHTHTDTQTCTDAQSSTEEDRYSDGTSPQILSAQPSSIIVSEKHTPPVMCCVAIFAFRGEERDELSFCEGDVITLTDYVNDEWGRGHLKGHSGIFPLCFTSSPQPHSETKTE